MNVRNLIEILERLATEYGDKTEVMLYVGADDREIYAVEYNNDTEPAAIMIEAADASD